MLIEQNAMGSPSGMPTIKVTANIIKEIKNPLNKNAVISKNDIKNFSFIHKSADGGFAPSASFILYLVSIKIISGLQNP